MEAPRWRRPHSEKNSLHWQFFVGPTRSQFREGKRERETVAEVNVAKSGALDTQTNGALRGNLRNWEFAAKSRARADKITVERRNEKPNWLQSELGPPISPKLVGDKLKIECTSCCCWKKLNKINKLNDRKRKKTGARRWGKIKLLIQIVSTHSHSHSPVGLLPIGS